MNYKKIGIFFGVLFSCFLSNAQNLTQSIYSQYGIGEIFPNTFGQQNQIGGASVGTNSETDFSMANPASYSHLKYTVYNVGVRGFSSNVQTAKANAKTSGFSYSHICLAFPLSLKNNIGASFGFLPYSAYGYSSSNVTTSAVLKPFTNVSEGSGGTSRVYAGTGFNLSKNLSIGANASYLFGESKYTSKVVFDAADNLYNHKTDQSKYTSGLLIDAGAQYQIMMDDYKDTGVVHQQRTRLTIGANYSLNAGLKTNSTIYSRSYGVVNGFDYDIDTSYFSNNEKGNISLPSKLNIGFNYGKDNKWKIAGEYATQQWSKYKENGNTFGFLVNDMQLSLGGSYIPNYNVDVSKKYLSHIEYRFGVRNYTSNLMLNGQRISETALNFGVGLPFYGRAQRNKKIVPFLSYLNLGVEYGMKGTTNYGLAKENTFRFYFSLNLLDIWFDKFKYD